MQRLLTLALSLQSVLSRRTRPPRPPPARMAWRQAVLEARLPRPRAAWRMTDSGYSGDSRRTITSMPPCSREAGTA